MIAQLKHGDLPDKVDLQMIRNKIVNLEYITRGTLTICLVEMQNGFKVIGQSACVDPALYSKSKGELLAFNDAIDKLYGFEGYLLAEQRKNYRDLVGAQEYPREIAKGSCGVIKKSTSVNKPLVQPSVPPDKGVWIEPVMTIHHSDHYYDTDRNKPLNPVHDSEYI